jgi:hypothetical protein
MKTKTIIRALFWGVMLVAFYFISTHIWFIDGHYCFNAVDICEGVNK